MIWMFKLHTPVQKSLGGCMITGIALLTVNRTWKLRLFCATHLHNAPNHDVYVEGFPFRFYLLCTTL